MKPEGVEMEADQETVQWSADKKSYVAAKIIPGFGTLVYIACTNDPELGWDENGFANYCDISDVPNFPAMKQQQPADAAAPTPAPSQN